MKTSRVTSKTMRRSQGDSTPHDARERTRNRVPAATRGPGRILCLALLIAGLAAFGSTPADAQPAKPRPPIDADGTTVVPDDFLRRWDPITVFFERAVGPAEGGPVDDASSWVTLAPAHPIAADWLDARTLRLRPVDPWPALERFTLRVDGQRFGLQTLLAPPIETTPATGSEGQEALRTLTLAFAEPLDETDLARALTIGLRPLPGLDSGTERRLDQDDFEIKVLERQERSEPARYVVTFPRPLPEGQRVTVRMRLSRDPVAGKPSGEVEVLRTSTAEAFRATAFGCWSAQLPVTPTGSSYPEEQAVRCDDNEPTLVVNFSSQLPGEIDLLTARNLVRLSPSVPDLQIWGGGNQLYLRGELRRDVPYRLALAPAGSASGGFVDHRGRALDLDNESSMWLYFPARAPYLQWQTGAGLVERLGPQTVPIEGRGDPRVDLRIHPIGGLDQDFWPFTEWPLLVDETQRPPGPGEEPRQHQDPWRGPSPAELIERIRALSSPTVSTFLDLPLGPDRAGARFGLDLRPTMEQHFGARRPGAYLVGLRRLDGSAERSWTRLQVTDLALTVVEEGRRVVFAVTSLATGRPVPDARIRVEGAESNRAGLSTFFADTTGPEGRAVWDLAAVVNSNRRVRRIVVEHDSSSGLDRLVLDAAKAPDVYENGAFIEDSETWLQWTQQVRDLEEPKTLLGHVFSDRPVYRPEEPVHLMVYLREHLRGRLQAVERGALFVVAGPGGREWRLDAEVDAQGIGYALFDVEDLPSGLYRVRVDAAGHRGLTEMTFKKEAYRLPRFEVLLDGPEGDGVADGRATLDAPFRVDLAATYYAGGRVARRPVRWRVTQFPHAWTPSARDGFVFSSDGRFSRTSRFESTPALDREALTDDDGGAVLEIDPSIEPTAQSRVYVVEATVTGADDQTVTATRRVVALPPFLLGLDTPRFLGPGEALEPRVLAIGVDDQPLAGQEITVRLLHRQWHSHLRASDFSDGVARYVTDVVDETVYETTVTSTDGPSPVPLPLGDPGVYVVEIESRDRLGRAQVVAVDLYAAGADDAPVAWERPKDQTFGISTDAASYAPGETARLVLRSPFQEARALVVVETPDGNRYRWHEVRGGEAVVELPIEGHWAPRLPVHAVLMRGRVPGTSPRPGNAADLGKPATLIATEWVDVQPRALRVEVGLDHPPEAMPGRTIEVEVSLKTPDGQPTSGTVALWLVDRAVLALGKERRIDPLPDFLKARDSRLSIRDTRGMVFGDLPLVELPGGDVARPSESVLDRQTVRRNFQPVPYFEPRVEVGADGVARVEVPLPDNLTDFAIRAKAVAGPMRFGFAKSRLSVRLPVIVQPALPRFVRPGDRFTAAAIGRVVSGDGGAGRAQAKVTGVELLGDAEQAVELSTADPLRIELPVRVPTPTLDERGRPEVEEAVFQIGLERTADGAGDAFEVRLPIRDDRRPVVRRELIEMTPEQPYTWPAIEQSIRPGTLSRSVLFSDRPGPLRLAAGLDALIEYPYGCLEQRISRTRAQIAMARFRDVLALDAMDNLQRQVDETLSYIREVTHDSGLVSYWPGGHRYVSLTAWTVQFLAEAQEAGFTVDPKTLAPLRDALRRALRSDYGGFVDGSEWAERVMALEALAWLGDFDPAYGAELGRRAQFLVSEDLARLVLALERGGEKAATSRPELIERLWRAIVFRLHQGQEIYGGLDGETVGNPLILPSETRTLSTIVRALARTAPQDRRLGVLESGLVRLGQGDGWGSTQADAAALLALAERLDPELPGSNVGYRVRLGDRSIDGSMASSTARLRLADAGAVEVEVDGPLTARVESRWLPAGDGASIEAERRGFVVERTVLVHDSPTSTAPPRRVPIDQPTELALDVGTVVEEHIRVVSPRDRHFVALIVPLAAGVEALNPRLATAPPEATPDGTDTLTPTYIDVRDDHVAYYFDRFPKGTHDVYFRARASTEGSFVQPPARCEAMYDLSVVGHSAGARIEVVRVDDQPDE